MAPSHHKLCGNGTAVFVLLVVSPFNWIDRVLEEVSKKVECMLSAEASRDSTVKGGDDPAKEEAAIDRLHC